MLVPQHYFLTFALLVAVAYRAEPVANVGSLTFDEARAYCEGLTLDGGGFRVLSMKEVQTLVDETRQSGPSIDTEAFPGLPELAPTFWTSSPSADFPDAAWFFRNGLVLDVGKGLSLDSKHSVRCVR